MLDTKDIIERQSIDCSPRDSLAWYTDWWYWEGWMDRIEGLTKWPPQQISDDKSIPAAYEMGWADAEGELNGYSTDS